MYGEGVGSSAKARGLHKLLHAYSSWAVCVGLIYKDKQVIELVNRDQGSYKTQGLQQWDMQYI